MRLALYTILMIGAILLGFDLAKEVKNIPKTEPPAPTQAVHPTAPKDHENLPQLIEKLTSKIKATPNNAQLYAERANLYMAIRQTDQAIADLDQAITLDPNNTDTLVQRGSYLLMFGKEDKAIADFNQALKITPTLTQALVYRAIIFFRKEQYQPALDDCLLILKQDPSIVDVHYTIALCYNKLKKPDEAIKHLKRYIAHTQDPEGKTKATQLLKSLTSSND